MSRASRIGFLGGTFDPVHAGHLAMARMAERVCRLERVYFVPAPLPWHRAAPLAGFADRFAMLGLALAGHPRWQPLAIPDRPRRPTYTIDQLAWMAEHNLLGEIHLIVGADAFATLPTWHQYRRLLRSYNFIVLARRGAPPPAMNSPRLSWLAGFDSPVAATRVRAALAAGRKPRRQIPAAVAEYALRAGLYRSAQLLAKIHA